MNTGTKWLVAAALFSASSALAADKAKKPAEDPNQKGSCYGVVGKEAGECAGKDAKTGATWSCAGQNPTADLGWKSMTRADCDKTPKHKDAKTKHFVPDPA